jgi:hypothetical protein
MKEALSIVALTTLAMIMTALPATGEEPFPPADWQQTARFSGDYLYASFEGESGYLSINGYDGSFKLPGVKGKGIQDELVTVIFDAVSCDPVTGIQTERHLFGGLFTGDGDVPVFNAETHTMNATFQLHGIERIYNTTDCSWENRMFVNEEEISAEFTIEGIYATSKCKGKCFAVCEFVGSMSLTYEATNLLEGIPFDTVMEGFGGTRHGDIFWFASP